ncbi:MAG: hypothetical protein HOO67_07755 [Candidatus Peribacteraceae bacterium]|nr:hypothetical protein [Candidatus Peribacteraceae bacterium]
MRINRPDQNNQQREGVTRRGFLIGTVGTAAAIGTLLYVKDDIGKWLHAPGHDDHGHEAPPVTEDVRQVLIRNRDQLIQLEAQGPQRYYDQLQHGPNRILIPEEDVLEIDVNCVDERKRRGTAHGVAGVGVLLTPDGRERLSRNIVAKARVKFERSRRPVRIRLNPHLGGKCGAAKLSLHNKGRTDINPTTIVNEARAGAMLLLEEVRRIAREEGVPVQVEMSPFPEDNFVQDGNHAGGITFVNTLQDKVLNTEQGGAHAYNVSHIGGSQTMKHDAFLCATLALKSGHGMHDRADIGLPRDIPHKIILGGQGDMNALKQEYEHDLARDPTLGQEYADRKLKVETWNVPRE